MRSRLMSLVFLFLTRTASAFMLSMMQSFSSSANRLPQAPMLFHEGGGDLFNEAMSRWERLEQGRLEEDYDSLVDRLSATWSARDSFDDEAEPAVSRRQDSHLSIREHDTSYTVSFHVPGVKAGDYEVSVQEHERMLTIVGTVYKSTFGLVRPSRVSHSIALPSDADVDVRSTTYADGHVVVSLPKIAYAVTAEEQGQGGSASRHNSEAERLAAESPRFARWLRAHGYVGTPSFVGDGEEQMEGIA